ncbi:hypothetical protein COOONC_26388 [Cooperia oncophora]
MDNNLREEIMRRKKCAWTAMGRIREAAQLISDRKIRAALFDSTVLPALCYASETWAENKASTLMLTRAQRALERTLLNINRREQRCRNLRSTDMRSMSGILDAVVYAWNAKKRWAGHVTNTGSKPLKIANNGGKRVLVAEENRLKNERPSIQATRRILRHDGRRWRQKAETEKTQHQD